MTQLKISQADIKRLKITTRLIAEEVLSRPLLVKVSVAANLLDCVVEYAQAVQKDSRARKFLEPQLV